MELELKKTTIQKAIIDDVLAGYLYSISYVNDDEDITNIKLGKVNKDGEMPLSFEVKKKILN